MRFKYYNPNKKNKVAGDCVVRMLTVVTNKSWNECYWMVCEEGEKLGDMPSSNHVWLNLLSKLGFKRHIIPDSCPFCYTIDQFCADHQKGIFVVGTGSHVLQLQSLLQRQLKNLEM